MTWLAGVAGVGPPPPGFGDGCSTNGPTLLKGTCVAADPRRFKHTARPNGKGGSGYSSAAYTRLRNMVRKYSRWPGPCDMNTANSSSLGSIQKNVPAMPLQKNWPTDPGNGAMPAWVRTAKPRPKLWPAGTRCDWSFTPEPRWSEAN